MQFIPGFSRERSATLLKTRHAVYLHSYGRIRQPVSRGDAAPMKKVLILCTGNSARSQLVEGLLRHEAGDRFEVFSAGTKPTKLRPEAIAVMQELGIDISQQRSKSADDLLGQKFDYVITVCDNARESCPVFPGPALYLHWSLEDPATARGSEDERKLVFRRIRDEIAERLKSFAAGEKA